MLTELENFAALMTEADAQLDGEIDITAPMTAEETAALAAMRAAAANDDIGTFAVLMDEADSPEMNVCDGCDCDITDAMYDANDGFCQACLDARMECVECEDRILKTDAHKKHKTLCEGCGDAKDEEARAERIEALETDLREWVDTLCDDTGDDNYEKALKAAIKAIERIAKRSK